MEILFPTSYKNIISRVQNTRPLEYAGTRNFVEGSVTYLSPYISRGVISVMQLRDIIFKEYTFKQTYKFIQELAWREYWQRVWQSKKEEIFTDLKKPQPDYVHKHMISAIAGTTTTIEAIDKHINLLFKNGYMHNHIRMYVASLACNIAKAHWLQPAKWLYYHLLDADAASNHLSWQWVAGSFSLKKYYCNQENINRYTSGHQKDSYLDKEYAELTSMPVPEPLQSVFDLTLETILPVTPAPSIDQSLPTLIYNAYNLDPLWRNGEKANRILLLEPSHFNAYPLSKKVIDFIIDLSKNIAGLQIYAGEINELFSPSDNIISKEHPAFTHYPGKKDSRDWLFPQVEGYYPSFSAFWKKCGKLMQMPQ